MCKEQSVSGKLVDVSVRALEEGIPDTLNPVVLDYIREEDGTSARRIQNHLMQRFGVDQGVGTYWTCLAIAEMVKSGAVSISSGGVIKEGKLEPAKSTETVKAAKTKRFSSLWC